MRAILIALLMLLPATARAATDPIFALYAEGDYDQAVKAGEAAHTAAGYAIAARAVLADAMLRDAPCMDCLKHAESLSRQAIAADPGNAYGQIWLAVALGYQARLTGIVRARVNNIPAQTKAALEAALKDDPKNPYAVSALGGWHIEIVHGGGSYLAWALYGATESEALKLYDRAIRLAPENVAVRYQVALSLAGFDAEKYRARILSDLAKVIAGTPVTAYEKKMQARAGELLGLMTLPAHDGLAARVRKYQGYPD